MYSGLHDLRRSNYWSKFCGAYIGPPFTQAFESLGFGYEVEFGSPYDDHSLLLGDAAGLCGAFAADGIKGAVVSGQVAARLIPEVLEGNPAALKRYYPEIQKNNKLMSYYYK